MRAMTVVPGRNGTARVETLDEPPVAQGELLVSGRLQRLPGAKPAAPSPDVPSADQKVALSA